MEVISKMDAIKIMKGTKESGEMRLLTAGHTICLRYSNRGKTINGTCDGESIQGKSAVVYHLLDELTDNNKRKIKLFQPQSERWKKIRMSDEEINQKVIEEVNRVEVGRQYKGYTYLCEALCAVCKEHIAGHVVDVVKTLRDIAKIYGVERVSLENSIRIAVGYDWLDWNKKYPEINEYFHSAQEGTRVFIRNFSYYLLDRWYRLSR